MGLLDKIKNALFEVEYVEVEEKPKKEKKSHDENAPENVGDKPIAKKILLPGNKEEKIEELHEVELEDEDFEIRPKDENIKSVFKDNFNVMEDDDFYVSKGDVKEKDEVVEEPVKIVDEPPKSESSQSIQNDTVKEYDLYKNVNNSYEDYHIKSHESRPYGMDPSYQVAIKEYGTENREEKAYFRPSPIISPIYGILDKNYRKEDVVAKKEVRLTSSYSRTNMNVDDIRNKAYGKRSEVTTEYVEEKKKIEPPSFEVEDEEDNLLVDLSDEKKPEVKEITVGDAIEYYQDLGLEYNVDYVDASSKNPPKPKPDNLEEEIKDNLSSNEEDHEDEETALIEKLPEDDEEVEESSVNEKVESVSEDEKTIVEKDKSKKKDDNDDIDDDDNLFDLIDSMYREEDS